MGITITRATTNDPIARELRQATARQPWIGPLMKFFAFMAPTGFPKRVFFQFAQQLPPPLNAADPDHCNPLFNDLDDRGLVLHSKVDLHLFGPVLASVRKGIPSAQATRIIEQAGRFLLATLPLQGTPTVFPHELNRLSWHALVLAEHAMKIGNHTTATHLMQWLDRSGRKLITSWPDRAVNCHQSALHLSQRILGPQHPLTIVRLNNLGETWRRLKEPTRAQHCLLGAIALLQQHPPGYRHLEANILGNIGLLQIDQRQWEEAYTTFHRAWSMANSTRGLDDPLIFLCVNNLARILIGRNDLQAVVDLLQQALERHNQINHAVPHLNIAVILNNLAFVQKKMGCTEGANDSLQQALVTALKFLPEDHPQVIRIRENLHPLNLS
ncbi:MAG: tetratricopeptide repeat protein [Magnetococcales bacterium]|nr:tetratricopeptide repeat protein [Magnetococcales bacterium]